MASCPLYFANTNLLPRVLAIMLFEVWQDASPRIPLPLASMRFVSVYKRQLQSSS